MDRNVPDLYTDEVIWAHAYAADAEQWEGPYATREEAEEAARDDEHDYVCECRWISKGKVAAQAADPGWLLERMDETDFIGGTFDEAIFEISPAHDKEATVALERALSEWAEKYIDSPPRFMCVAEPVKVAAR